MNWEFNNDTPIYLQIMEQIKAQIAIGNIKAGDKLPPVREMAVEAEVNPNTMQKALSELEREGLVYSQRTSGRFVSDNSEKVKSIQEELLIEYMSSFTENMSKLGYTREEAANLYMEYSKKK